MFKETENPSTGTLLAVKQLNRKKKIKVDKMTGFIPFRPSLFAKHEVELVVGRDIDKLKEETKVLGNVKESPRGGTLGDRYIVTAPVHKLADLRKKDWVGWVKYAKAGTKYNGYRINIPEEIRARIADRASRILGS